MTWCARRRVTLHLKEDAEDLLSEEEIQRLIRTYSEFISFPIRVWQTNTKTKRVEDAEATAKAQEEADKKAKEAGKARALARLLVPLPLPQSSPTDCTLR